GHLHANSGWGTFDDDNMVGATAFRETLELALELRRIDYGAGGERLGFDLYPYTEDQVGAVRRSVLQWRFIDSVAARIDGDAAILARAQAGYPVSTPRPGWVEQDPEDWWRATEQVLGQLAAEAGTPAGIGLSGQMHGLVALDSADRVLRPAILWKDQRAAVQCRELEAAVGLRRLIELTGNRALAGFTAPKLLWLREHEPDIWRRVAHIMLPKDYVRLRLCGTRV